jgi:hypothetical protein
LNMEGVALIVDVGMDDIPRPGLPDYISIISNESGQDLLPYSRMNGGSGKER